MAIKIGNYLCHALSIGGCEHSNVVNALGYGAMILPVAALAMLMLHGGHRH